MFKSLTNLYNIRWRDAEMQVLQMQYDIATAWKCGNMQLVSELQQKLVRSFADLLLVHKLCHDQVTYCMDKNLRAAFVLEGIIILPKKPTELKKPNKIISLKELSKPRKKPTR